VKRFGIIAHTGRSNVEQTVKLIIDWLEKQKLEYWLCEDLTAIIDDKKHVLPLNKIWESVDCVLSLGGDGTMLSSIRAVGKHGIPVFGINIGRLGFLTEILASDIPNALQKLKNDEYIIEARMVLQTHVIGTEKGTFCALNDVVLDHGDSTRLIKLDLYRGDQFVCSYNSDGLIISTPTGSTAYNLAAGGPVIYPHLGALIASPICPHSLTLRPIVFDNTSELHIKIAHNDIDVRLTVDGQINCILDPDAEVVVRKAPHNAKLIRIQEYSFFEILRTKLHWGARPLTADNA
jgi:NAD+ kinase